MRARTGVEGDIVLSIANVDVEGLSRDVCICSPGEDRKDGGKENAL